MTNGAALLRVLDSGFVRGLELDDDGWTLTWWNDNADEFEITVPQNKLGELGVAMLAFFCGEKTYYQVKESLGVKTLSDVVQTFLNDVERG